MSQMKYNILVLIKHEHTLNTQAMFIAMFLILFCWCSAVISNLIISSLSQFYGRDSERSFKLDNGIKIYFPFLYKYV